MMHLAALQHTSHLLQVISESFRKSRYICLGNIDPILQMRVLEQVSDPQFVVCDTMNLWINLTKQDLLKLLKRVHVFILNDSEARMLTEEPNLIKAAKLIRKMGPEILIIKKGEHGAMLFTCDTIFSA